MLGAALLLLARPEIARSQDSAQVNVGSRIRVKPAGPGQSWLTGSLLELPGDSVRLVTSRPRKDSVAIALNSLAAFEWSQGVRSRTGRGALIGLGAGALAGLILGVVTFEECTGFCILDLDRGETGLLGALVGGLFGTGVGMLFGATVREDRWVPVPQPWTADSSGR
ncbi:MAG TPA: hypothetical protein VFH26_03515 [Gemmatimonadales bacterium]|nr:hypothetical protein [Gemmatimonadales bacterium]